MTGQSLYYMGRTELQHKILAVAEEEGVSEAAYALKLLQSDARLAIASAGKDSDTGRQQTQHYEVEGPVAMLLTTTAEEPDAELANRCLVLSVNEQPAQTAAIHQRQRAAYTLDAVEADVQAVRQRHQDAQRLLEPLAVILPWAEQLTFRTDQTRMRRDHAQYLALIASLTLLHQYQRQQLTRHGSGQTERCVVAAVADVAWANRLLSAALGARVDPLLPQTHQLLEKLAAYVVRRAETEGATRSEVRFTQRELRETLGWNDRALRRQLARLVDLEYVLVYRTGRGNQRVYQLLYDGRAQDGAPLLLGLADPQRLVVRGNAEARSPAESSSTASLASSASESRVASPPNGTEPAVCPCEPAAIRRPSGSEPAAPQNAAKSRRRQHFHSKPAV